MTMTERQQQVLDALVQGSSEGWPTLDQIAERVGLTNKNTIRYHMLKLEAQGLVTLTERRRMWVPTDAGKDAANGRP